MSMWRDAPDLLLRASAEGARVTGVSLVLAAAAYAAWAVPLGPWLGHTAAEAAVAGVLLFAVGHYARRQLARGAPGAGGVVTSIALLACLWIARFAGQDWLSGPMHDIALAHGTHGRWGCTTVNPDGSDLYFFDDFTVPWLVVLPLMIAVAAQAILRRVPAARERARV
jgi:hypothetical protein